MLFWIVCAFLVLGLNPPGGRGKFPFVEFEKLGENDVHGHRLEPRRENRWRRDSRVSRDIAPPIIEAWSAAVTRSTREYPRDLVLRSYLLDSTAFAMHSTEFLTGGFIRKQPPPSPSVI